MTSAIVVQADTLVGLRAFIVVCLAVNWKRYYTATLNYTCSVSMGGSRVGPQNVVHHSNFSDL